MFGLKKMLENDDKLRLSVMASVVVVWLLFGAALQLMLLEQLDSVQDRVTLWGAISVCVLICLGLLSFLNRRQEQEHRRLGIAADALYDMAHPNGAGSNESGEVPASANGVYDALMATKQVVRGKINAAEVLANFNQEISNQSNWQKVLDALNEALMQLAGQHDKSVVFRFGEQDSSHYRFDAGARKSVKQRLRLSEAEEAKLYRCDNGDVIDLAEISPTLTQCQPNFDSTNCAMFRLSGSGGGYGFIFLCHTDTDTSNALLTEQVNALAQLAGAALSRCERESNLYRLANFDSLTGLPNRILLEDRTNQALRLAKRYQHRIGLMFIDLDGFKRINDSLGHSAGDKLLQGVADRLRTCIRESDTVARLAGDEFVVLVSEITDSEQST